MAMYFYGNSESQASDNLQTLYLMNPNYLPPPEETQIPHTQTVPSSMVFTASHALVQGTLPHAPSQQNLISIPVPGSHLDDDSSNLWSPTVNPVGSSMGFLNLLPRQQVKNNGQLGVKTTSESSGMEGVMIVGRSKYLKIVQELLDELVSVVDFSNNGGDDVDDKGCYGGSHKKRAKMFEGSSGGGGGGGGGGESKGQVDELLSAEQRQELQMKKAKLLNMFDEVGKRYKQYNTQMQVLISYLEQILGFGSAKSYTSLALKTVSRQFRSLIDAISSHIKIIVKTLGEDKDIDKTNNSIYNGGHGGSRLRFVDHNQIGEQEALEQLAGVIHHHNAWRLQRGLPKRAVSILRAWLFQHFLHPYPKDSDKHMLAKQTGLTRSQVSNWFINARVRLWKPMVEEMYMEEIKSQDQTCNNNDNLLSKDHNIGKSTSKTSPTHQHHHEEEEEEQQLDNIISGMIHHQPHHLDHPSTNNMITNMSTMSTTSTQGFSLIGTSSDMDNNIISQSSKKQSGPTMQSSPSSILSMDLETKTNYHRHYHHQIYKYSQDSRNSSIMSNGSGLSLYVVPDIGRFNPDPIGTNCYQYTDNNVSLTLGLPRYETMPTLSKNEQHNFIQNQGKHMGRSVEIGVEEGEFSHPSNIVYDSINIQSH